jgi:hypothetical protein
MRSKRVRLKRHCHRKNLKGIFHLGRRWANIFNIKLKEMGRGDVGWIHLAQRKFQGQVIVDK